MTIKALFIYLLLIPLVACGGEETNNKISVLTVKQQLKSFLFSKYDDFQITEIFSKKEDKMTFLKSKLGVLFIKNVTQNESVEMLFKQLSEATDSHVGAIALSYPSTQDAQKAYQSIEASGYFKNTKIMTRYSAFNRDNINLVIYTESAGDKLVSEYVKFYMKDL